MPSLAEIEAFRRRIQGAGQAGQDVVGGTQTQQQGQMPGYGSNGGMPRPSGGASQGHGMFGLGGTLHNQGPRPGAPQEGVVGSPNLGMASEINRLISQGVLTSQQAAQMGVLPQISTYRPMGGNTSPASMHAMLNPGGSSAAGYNYGAFSRPPQGSPSGSSSPAAGFPGAGGAAPGGGMGGAPYQREQSPFELSIQNAIGGNLGDQSGQRRRMQTQLGESISGATASNLQSTREDAVRRGATGAQGDADIRDQLNRSIMQGGADQARGRNEIESILQGFKNQAIGQGTSLLGEQGQDVRSLREMITMLEALKQQNSPLSGLNFSLGGR